MADEPELAPDGGLAPEVAPEIQSDPGDEDPNPNVNDELAADPVEALAMDMGWTPKDKFRGDPEQWKPAADFIKAGRDIQRSLSRELRQVRETVTNIERTSASLFEERLREQKAELERQFNEAVEAGDTNGARQLATRFNEIGQQAQPIAPREALDFAERNKDWFGKDPLATARAHEIAARLQAQGYSAAEQVAQAERAVKKEFPELFPAPAKQPPSVAHPASRTAGTSNRAKGFHDLPPEAQKVARDMVERGVILSADAYVKNYFKQETGR